MFTGIIEEIGKLERIEQGAQSAVLHIQAKKVLEDVAIGDSIAVNGICLTVTSYNQKGFSADVMHETLNRTGLLELHYGNVVNLERAMAANGRFGGHMVAGHIDGMGTVINLQKDDNAIWYTIQAKSEIMRYVVEKGSVAIDGISLTVAKVTQDSFAVSVIPHTVKMTALKERRVGDVVNLETDIIGKYVEKLLGGSKAEKLEPKNHSLNQDFLAEHGFC